MGPGPAFQELLGHWGSGGPDLGKRLYIHRTESGLAPEEAMQELAVAHTVFSRRLAGLTQVRWEEPKAPLSPPPTPAPFSCPLHEEV